MSGNAFLPVKAWTNVPTTTCVAPINFSYGGSIQAGAGQRVTVSGAITASPFQPIFDNTTNSGAVITVSKADVWADWFVIPTVKNAVAFSSLNRRHRSAEHEDLCSVVPELRH